MFAHGVHRVYGTRNVLVNAGHDDDPTGSLPGGADLTGQYLTGHGSDLLELGFGSFRTESEHVPYASLDGQHRTEGVYPKQLLQVGELQIGKDLHAHFAGVADEYVQAAQFPDHGVHRRPGGTGIGQIHMLYESASTESADGFRGEVGVVAVVRIGDCYVATVFRQRQCRVTADSRIATGNDGIPNPASGKAALPRRGKGFE